MEQIKVYINSITYGQETLPALGTTLSIPYRGEEGEGMGSVLHQLQAKIERFGIKGVLGNVEKTSFIKDSKLNRMLDEGLHTYLEGAAIDLESLLKAMDPEGSPIYLNFSVGIFATQIEFESLAIGQIYTGVNWDTSPCSVVCTYVHEFKKNATFVKLDHPIIGQNTWAHVRTKETLTKLLDGAKLLLDTDIHTL